MADAEPTPVNNGDEAVEEQPKRENPMYSLQSESLLSPRRRVDPAPTHLGACPDSPEHYQGCPKGAWYETLRI